MRLDSITLQGFKSFGEKAVVKVLPGITGIVGPNGCGKCIEGRTPVVLADGRLVAIRDLVEDAVAAATAIHRFEDGVAVSGGGSDIRVLSLDPDTLRLESRPVEAFIRREAPQFLLRVTTRSGREIVSTHYHPFFSLSKGTLEVLTAEHLVEGVRIAVPRRLPVKSNGGESLTEAVLARIRRTDRVFVPCSGTLRAFIARAATKAGGRANLAGNINVSEAEFLRVDQGRPVNVAVLGAVAALGTARPDVQSLQCGSRGRIRLPEELDARLARFLGLMVAEGRTTASNQVWFVNSDPEVNDDFVRLATELFGKVPFVGRYKRTAVDTIIFSRALCVLLDRVFGFTWNGKSANKSVPPQLWTASDDVIGSFLSGLFEGDAFVHAPRDATGRAMPYIEYTTASRRLADEVATLLLRLGIVPQIRRRERYAANTRARRRRTYWSVYVYGVRQVKLFASFVRFVGTKQQRLDAALKLEAPSNPNVDLIPGGAALVREAIVAGGLTVKPLRRLSPRLAAYADGRCDPGRDGLAEVARIIEALGATPRGAAPLLHRMRTLAESDVAWDEVTRIERIPPPEPWVYDLTVADTHNFVAGNIIAHNSNISEAVRWALGEQSAKSLRGQRMEDLIFHGSASHKPVGLAEVMLTFSNDGTLSVPWSEIAVSRRLYRTGESEYLLNSGVTRLRDILDLFAGTGANPRAYSVMDQDKLNHVLTAKPHERRVFIEEAAGIARYKQQRNETQGKLEATRQNLVRVRDVMDEVKRQLGSLERQARKARQYKALQNEKRELSLALLAADWAALTSDAERLAGELARLRDGEQALRTRVAGLTAREATQREAIQVSDHRLGDLRQSVQKVQGELERLLERREQMGVQMRELHEETVRLEDDLRVAGERLMALGGERERGRSALTDAQAAVNERGSAAAGLEAELERHRQDLASERDRVEALRLEQVRLAAERTDLMREAGELRERQAQLARRAERLGAELAAAEAEAARLASHGAVLETSRDRVVAELTTLAGERERLEARLAEREQARGAAEERLAAARLQLASRRSSFEALRDLERVREGYGDGVRAVFAADGRAAVAGVVGTVADLLDVPPGLERAVEAVLGERLQWVVVERFEHARAAVRHLRDQGAGTATFLPLDRLSSNGGSHEGAGPDGRAAGPWVAEQIGGTSRPLLDYLLGRVQVAPSLDDAERLWRRNGVVATYVTPDGEVLAPTGRLHGGASDPGTGAAHSLLGRKSELRELEGEVVRLTAATEAAQTEMARLDAEVSALRARLPLLQQSIHAGEAERLAGEKDLEQTVREQARVLRHRETVQAEARQVGLESEETERTLTVLGQRMTTAREAETMHERAMVGLRESIDRAQDRDQALVADLTGCRVEIASATERVEALGRELTRLDEIEADLHERLGTTRQRQTQLQERRAWLVEERERTDAAAREVAIERDRVEEEARAAGQRHEGLLAELRALEAEIRSVEGEVSRVVGAIHEVELRATEGRVRREELVQEAWRGYGVDAEALHGRHDATRDLDAARAGVAALDERLAAIGAVNLVADDEYRELDERLTFLRTQHDDLVGSVKDLEKALRGMTRTAQERFTQAFHEINRHFGEIFERLFEGGRAELRLVEAEEGGDPLDTGVELMAQPRGKRLQVVSLMSGGERALTGLALLFAIFYFRPSPFCVLDEVDAPLDDANIHRFLRVLRALTSQTQFLVITHNRKTMEAADILYGVTMEEPGLSKLVSVAMNAV